MHESFGETCQTRKVTTYLLNNERLYWSKF